MGKGNVAEAFPFGEEVVMLMWIYLIVFVCALGAFYKERSLTSAVLALLLAVLILTSVVSLR